MNKKIQNGVVCPKEQNINKSYDHREIGKRQNLFSFHPEGPGFPFFHPKGMALKNSLIDYWRKEHKLYDYQEIESPMMLNKELWVRSGHWDLFRENMYISHVDKGDFAVKPMNCPGSMLYFKEKKRSFKELPLRICELGKVHRNENSGSLHGLMRARSFIVDDAHIFCSKKDLKKEIKAIIKLCLKMLKRCGFYHFDFELSVRSMAKKAKYLGDNQDWNLAEKILQESLQEMNLHFSKMEGEAKFYGPAIDIKIKDSVGRSWQCSSIQMDFNLAQRFQLCYYDKNGKRKIPFIIHRCVFGSLERFIGVLLEHHQGRLPYWLSPIQVKVLPLNRDVIDYVHSLIEWLEERNIRYSADLSDSNLSSKIKHAQEESIPVMIIIGAKEKEQDKISVRFLSGEQKKLIDKEFLLNI